MPASHQSSQEKKRIGEQQQEQLSLSSSSVDVFYSYANLFTTLYMHKSVELC